LKLTTENNLLTVIATVNRLMVGRVPMEETHTDDSAINGDFKTTLVVLAIFRNNNYYFILLLLLSLLLNNSCFLILLI